jgi:hypothetical protein
MNIRQIAHGTIIEACSMSNYGGDFVALVGWPSFALPTGMAIDGPFSVRSLNASLFRRRRTQLPCILQG